MKEQVVPRYPFLWIYLSPTGYNPPFNAEVENLDTGEEWEGVIGTLQGNLLKGTFDNLTDGDYEVTINVSPRCFLTLEFKVESNSDPITITATSEPICMAGTWSTSLDVSDGTEQYSFLRSNGATVAFVIQL